MSLIAHDPCEALFFFSCVLSLAVLRLRRRGDTFEPIIPPERAIKEWVPDDEQPDLWDQTAEFPSDWNQCRNPELWETDLGDGRILVPWFD
jgi:hypothetical protein